MLSFPPQGREFFVAGQDLWNWQQAAKQQAIAHSIPPGEVDWLLQELSNLERLDLRLGFKDWQQIQLEIPLEGLANLWQQRLDRRVPVQYLVGRAPWREFTLKVSPAVLIPRPETETIIDLAIKKRCEVRGARCEANPEPRTSYPEPENWADLGTGSGAIALGLAQAFPDVAIHAVDCSAAALAIARVNAAAYGLGRNIQFHQGSWLQPLHQLQGRLSGIVSNPPYIPSGQVLRLQPEVTRHEPHTALDGGSDGLDCIRHLVATAPQYLQSGGVWIVEMMAGQTQSVVELLEQNGSYEQVEIHADLAGIERFAAARRK